MSFQDRLKSLRKERGLTQQKLAKCLNVSQNAVYNWENGIREPNIDTIHRIAEILECDISDLFEPTLVFKKIDDLSEFEKKALSLERAQEKKELDFLNKINTLQNLLNDSGKRKVIEYAKDLSSIPKYRKNND